jgi:hypothetical protein
MMEGEKSAVIFELKLKAILPVILFSPTTPATIWKPGHPQPIYNRL